MIKFLISAWTWYGLDPVLPLLLLNIRLGLIKSNYQVVYA